MIKKSSRLHSGGQALVIVLLSLAVVLTIVLFVLARSTTDIAVSSRNEESVRAFSAAEAGVENALVVGSATGQEITVGGNTSYITNVTPAGEGQTSFNYPSSLSSGDSMVLWFVSHDANGKTTCEDGKCFTGSSLTVCWGNESAGSGSAYAPAIELSLFYDKIPGDPSSVNIGRITLDPNSARTSTGINGDPANMFSVAGGATTCGDKSYTFGNTIDLSTLVSGVSLGSADILQFARVRMLYNNVEQPLGFSVSGSTLPSQGIVVDSTGTAGESNRKVEVFQGWPKPPEIFDFSIYSPQGLIKN